MIDLPAPVTPLSNKRKESIPQTCILVLPHPCSKDLCENKGTRNCIFINFLIGSNFVKLKHNKDILGGFLFGRKGGGDRRDYQKLCTHECLIYMCVGIIRIDTIILCSRTVLDLGSETLEFHQNV